MLVGRKSSNGWSVKDVRGVVVATESMVGDTLRWRSRGRLNAVESIDPIAARGSRNANGRNVDFVHRCDSLECYLLSLHGRTVAWTVMETFVGAAVVFREPGHHCGISARNFSSRLTLDLLWYSESAYNLIAYLPR